MLREGESRGARNLHTRPIDKSRRRKYICLEEVEMKGKHKGFIEGFDPQEYQGYTVRDVLMTILGLGKVTNIIVTNYQGVILSEEDVEESQDENMENMALILAAGPKFIVPRLVDKQGNSIEGYVPVMVVVPLLPFMGGSYAYPVINNPHYVWVEKKLFLGDVAFA